MVLEACGLFACSLCVSIVYFKLIDQALIQRCNIAPFIYVCETKDLYILTFSETGVFFAIGICQYINAIKRQARDKLDDPAATPSKREGAKACMMGCVFMINLLSWLRRTPIIAMGVYLSSLYEYEEEKTRNEINRHQKKTACALDQVYLQEQRMTYGNVQ